jgi:hypothetical protein
MEMWWRRVGVGWRVVGDYNTEESVLDLLGEGKEVGVVGEWVDEGRVENG